MGYHFKVQKDGKFLIAHCIELEGCRTQGLSRKELQTNMVEVLTLFLDEPKDSKKMFPEPKRNIKKSSSVVEVYPELRVWFSHNLRQTRLKENISQREAAKRIGISSLSGYQKLEKRANPTIETVARIRRAFPEFDFTIPEAIHV